MSEWAGMVPTGRRISGPAADLVELDDGNDGLKHTAIVFQERYRAHPLLNRGVDLIKSFLEFPMVAGLCELTQWLPEEGAFIYPTGTTWTAAELLRVQREGNKPAGSKATLEMLYLAGMILQEAAETGPTQGAFSHGSLSPLRLMFKADGQVQIVGYGLPQVELAVWRDDPSMLPNEDGFRYAPPERLRGEREDGDADLYALALIAYEFLTNEPLFDGTVEQIRAAAAAGDAISRLDKAAKAKRIAPPVRDLLARALAPDPNKRHDSPSDFVDEVERLLSAIQSEGLTLADLMEKVRNESRRGRAMSPTAGREAVRSRGVPVANASDTMAFKKGPVGGIAIASIAGPSAAPRAAAQAPPVDEGDEEEGNTGASRWSKPARGGSSADAPSPSPRGRDRLKPAAEKAPEPKAPEPAAEDPRARLRERLKSKAGDAPAEAPAATEPVEAPAEDKSAARDALRDRLKRSSGTPTEPPPAEPQAAAPSELAPAHKSRQVAPAEAEPPRAQEAPAAKEEPKADARDALRDRLRRGRDEKPAEGAAAAPEPAAAAPAAPAAPAAAAPAAEGKADAREALRQRLKQRREE